MFNLLQIKLKFKIKISHSLLIGCGLIMFSNAYSQNENLGNITKLDTIIYAYNLHSTNMPITSCSKSGQLIYYNGLPHKDSICYGALSLTDYKLKRGSFQQSKTHMGIGYHTKLFDYINDTAYIKNKDNILTVAPNGDIGFVYKNEQLIHAKNILLTKNLLKFGWCYNNHPKSTPHKTFIYTKNLILDKDTFINPDFEGIQITHNSPNNFVDFTTDYTLFANAYNYDIAIYDNDLNTVGKADKSFPTTVSKSFLSSISTYNQPQDIFPDLRKGEKEFCRIWIAKFNTDTSFYVLYSKPRKFADTLNPDNFQFYFDFWKKDKNGQWVLAKADIEIGI